MGDAERGILKHVDPYRLTDEERQSIATHIWRDNTDRWWQQYKAYKAAMATFKINAVGWRSEAKAMGDELRYLWPDLPECPSYPEELTKVHTSTLKAQVNFHLKQ